MLSVLLMCVAVTSMCNDVFTTITSRSMIQCYMLSIQDSFPHPPRICCLGISTQFSRLSGTAQIVLPLCGWVRVCCHLLQDLSEHPSHPCSFWGGVEEKQRLWRRSGISDLLCRQGISLCFCRGAGGSSQYWGWRKGGWQVLLVPRSNRTQGASPLLKAQQPCMAWKEIAARPSGTDTQRPALI